MKFLRYIRQWSLVNKLLRRSLKWLAIDVPEFLKSHIVVRWRVVGNINLNVGEVAFNYYSNGDDGMADAIYYDLEKYVEKTELQLFLSFAKYSSFILDIGANTGLYSVTSSIVNPGASIFAFEPHEVNADRLAINLGLNKIKNVTIVRKVIGASCEVVKFTVPEDNVICDVLSANADFTRKFYTQWLSYKEVDKDQITLDSFVEQRGLVDIDLIKIDVESYELEVLKGARTLLEDQSPTIFCEIFVDELRAEFYRDFIKPLGYYCYAILETGLVRLDELIPNPDCKNFIFSKSRSSRQYLSYQEIDVIVKELKSQTLSERQARHRLAT